jgi:ribose transport system permease protein
MNTSASGVATGERQVNTTTTVRSWKRPLATALDPRRIGAVYVWIIAIIIFSALQPSVFPTTQTVQAIGNQYAITGLASISILVALAAGVFDLSIGANIGWTGMVFALLSGRTDIALPVAIAVAVLAGLAIGLLNTVVVVFAKIDSFIGTLATGAIVLATTTAISGGQYVDAKPGFDWTGFATDSFLGMSLPFYYLLLLAIALGYWLERTRSGRYIYATGFNLETSRLTGIRVDRMRAAGLATSGLIAGFAGVLLVARVGSATPDTGTAYLIPAFSAAFLGATQIRPGRFNPWGTLIAVFLLATGDFGIVTSGGPSWATSMFEGVVLLAAIGLAGVRRRRTLQSRAAVGIDPSSVQDNVAPTAPDPHQ